MHNYKQLKSDNRLKVLRKCLITIIGGSLCLLGLALLILPGPAWLLLPIGLAILSLEHLWARKWLKRSQRYLTQSAAYMDNKVAQFKAWRSR
ncbi:PGPGW domain-containing protein [Shewanella sp. AS1]|uniref:PGPGW domain-containing protein n=1 Tax=Shewanella sp. AS1 TaxID=2907626 RepID=UPI001F488B65|nr:PGPGW domain-containing protein [Shewanella sp. AS1]MCE9678574.1 PGPGW domain-containing protein [Shewanella sp. AS1]